MITFVLRSIRDVVKQLTGTDFNPSVMIADGADAIRNTFYATFPSAILDIMCFAHVIRNIRKQKFNNAKNKINILNDMRLIQLSATPQLFDEITKLFLRKWSKTESEFCSYFKKQWLGVHQNWYEGAAHYTPSTNNGLEGYNNVIKRLYTLRERLPFSQFTAMIKSQDLSNSYKEGKRCIADKPNVSLKLWRQAAQWLSNIKFVETFNSESSSQFCIPSDKFMGEFTAETVDKEKQKKYKSFDSYAKQGFGRFWSVNLNKLSCETHSNCNCKDFFKDYACVHVVGLALYFRLCKWPKSAIPTELSKRKAAGRRPKSSCALLVA